MDAQTDKRFDQFEYRRVEFEFVASELRRARLRLRLASNSAAAGQAIHDMQAAMRLYKTHSAIARIRHDQSTDDSFYAGEQAYYDQADARIALQEQSFYSTLLSSRHRNELEDTFGQLIFRKAENFKETVRAGAVESLAEENRLASSYLQMLSAASVVVDGQILPLSNLGPLLQSPDRNTRARAHRAEAGWYQKHAGDLDRLFNELVNTRAAISRKVGFRSFTDLAYKRLERFDYGRADVELLRQSVVRYIVPLTSEIRRLQRRRLGLDTLCYYDLPCLFPAGNPQVLISSEEIPGTAELVLAAITRQQPSFFQKLIDRDCLDLDARANKTPGGYCSMIINAGTAFILMNADGTARDVSTLLHEAGHAYAATRSLQDITLLEYLNPTLDACEIHSTTIEYLSYPHLNAFFGDAADDYALMHMTETLLFIPYGCMVDEFQHVVYDQPNLTPDERHQVWRALEKIYMPDLDYDEEPFYIKGGAWQKKEHIYADPFYYIEYVLAHLAALDIWQTSILTPDKAWRKYEKLCGMSGKETFATMLKNADIASPFDVGTIKRLAYAASSFLDL